MCKIKWKLKNIIISSSKTEVLSVTEADIVVAFPKFPGHLKFVVVENIVVVLVKLRNSISQQSVTLLFSVCSNSQHIILVLNILFFNRNSTK